MDSFHRPNVVLVEAGTRRGFCLSPTRGGAWSGHAAEARVRECLRGAPGVEGLGTTLKLAVDPPPIAPARVRQDAFAWSSA
jgi:hypothetical protein